MPPPAASTIPYQLLETHATAWDPSRLQPTLNLTLDGCIVPTQAGSARVDAAHLVVLDAFIDEPTRAGKRMGVMPALGAPSHAQKRGALSAVRCGHTHTHTLSTHPAPIHTTLSPRRLTPPGLLEQLVGPEWPGGAQPPLGTWERATCDAASLPPTWGLTVRRENADITPKLQNNEPRSSHSLNSVQTCISHRPPFSPRAYRAGWGGVLPWFCILA